MIIISSDSILRHFTSFTMTLGDMAGVAIFSASFYITFFAICRLKIFNRKKLAFCISTVNAFLMFILSILYMIVKSKLGHNILDYQGGQLDWWSGRDNFSTSVLIIFGMSNVMDLLIGWVFYSDHLYFLTTWIHHIVYIWLMVLLVTGEGYITSLPYPYTPAFVCALLEEFPTMILGLGTVFPQLRQDMIFGITFGLTRILFHMYLLAYMYQFDNVPMTIILCYVNPLLMHTHWFYNWATKYAFSKSRDADKEKEE